MLLSAFRGHAACGFTKTPITLLVPLRASSLLYAFLPSTSSSPRFLRLPLPQNTMTLVNHVEVGGSPQPRVISVSDSFMVCDISFVGEQLSSCRTALVPYDARPLLAT